jgi:hypothetical protein
MSEFTPYQKKVIKRYYDNIDKVALQRLAELVTEVYLAEGKKLERLWQQAALHMKHCEVAQSRIDHIIKEAKPQLLAALVTELQKRT